MAIAIGQTISIQQIDSSGTSSSASFGTLPAAGSLVVVEIFGWHGSAFDLTSVTDNQGNTYTLLKTVTASKSVGGASTTRGCIAYATNVASSGTFTITINGLGSGSYLTWGAQEWTGITTSSAADQSAQAASDSSSPVAVTTGTTTQADELVVAVIAAAGRTTNAGIDDPPSGYTSLFAQQDYANHNAGEACYKIISATGAQTASWAVSALDGSFECDANIITFKAAGGGAPAFANPFGLLGVGRAA